MGVTGDGRLAKNFDPLRHGCGDPCRGGRKRGRALTTAGLPSPQVESPLNPSKRSN